MSEAAHQLFNHLCRAALGERRSLRRLKRLASRSSCPGCTCGTRTEGRNDFNNSKVKATTLADHAVGKYLAVRPNRLKEAKPKSMIQAVLPDFFAAGPAVFATDSEAGPANVSPKRPASVATSMRKR